MRPLRYVALLFVLLAASESAFAGIPKLPDLPAGIAAQYRDPLVPRRQDLANQHQALLDEGRALNAACANIDKGSDKHQDCLNRADAFNRQSEALRSKMDALDDEICVARVLSDICSAKMPPTPASPEGLPAFILRKISPEYQDVDAVWKKNHQDTAKFCSMPSSAFTGPGQGCATLKAGFASERFKTRDKALAYADKLAKLRKMFPLPAYKEYQHGLILGLTAIGGLNVPPGSSDALRAHAEKDYYRQQPKEEPVVSPAGYDFVIGMAKSPVVDDNEMFRALLDNTLQGRYSAHEREVYPAIRGRSFDVLECHSNGAMICLVALSKGDVAARSVRLLGPQMTTSSLSAWAALVTDGQTESVDLYWIEGDPVPLISLDIDKSLFVSANGVVLNPLAKTKLTGIFDGYPRISVHFLPCPGIEEALTKPFFCHRIQMYQQGTRSAN